MRNINSKILTIINGYSVLPKKIIHACLLNFELPDVFLSNRYLPSNSCNFFSSIRKKPHVYKKKKKAEND